MLNLYHLKYFYDAATADSLLSAAQMNHVSSQAVSQAISSLETNLGIKLLEHKKNRLQLTAQGERLRDEAVKLLKQAEAVRGVVEKRPDKPSGTVKIAASSSVFHYILNRLLGKFVAGHEDVVVKSFHLPSAKIIDYLSRDQTEIGVLLHDSRLGAFETIEILEGEFVLISKGDVDLENARFFVKEEGPESWDFEKKYFKQYKKNPYIKGVLGSWETILDYVELGLGVGIIPGFINQRKRVKFKEPTLASKLSRYKIVVAFKARENLSEASELFIRALEEQVKSKDF